MTLRWSVTAYKIQVYHIRVIFKEQSQLIHYKKWFSSISLEMGRTILEFETPSKVHDPFWINLRLDAAKPSQIPTVHVFQRHIKKSIIDIHCV